MIEKFKMSAQRGGRPTRGFKCSDFTQKILFFFEKLSLKEGMEVEGVR